MPEEKKEVTPSEPVEIDISGNPYIDFYASRTESDDEEDDFPENVNDDEDDRGSGR